MEIERKWLVNTFKALEIIYGIVPLNIIQGYLNTMEDEYLIRYRSINNLEFILEIKSKGHLSRQELSYSISKEEFEEGMELCQSKIIKNRYKVKLPNDKIAEVDLYRNHDFITVEVEFKTEGEADLFDVPDWFGKDVTYDPKYKNINLVN